MTIAVVLTYGIALLVKLYVKLPAAAIEQLRGEQAVFDSVPFRIGYNLAIATGFVIIYGTRKQRRHYFLRAVVYSMLLAAVLGELMDILIPWRA
jgi:hypothetical protein